MKKLVFIIFVLYAQVVLTQDVLYLSTGQTVKCKIVDTLANGDLKIELRGGQTSVIPSSIIVSAEYFKNDAYFEFPRYRFIIEAGRYNQDYGLNGIRFNMSQGADLTPYIFGGVNLGYRSDLVPIDGYSALTLSADFRFYFAKGSIRPYFGAAIGSIFYLHDNNSILINPSFGTTIKITDKIDFTSAIGYETDIYMNFIYFSVGGAFRL